MFTDRRIGNEEKPVDGTSNRRGWFGDTVDINLDLHEGYIGSKLWLLWRSNLDYQTARRAENYARESLQVLIKQGVAASIDILAQAYPERGVLEMSIDIFSKDGTRIYQQKFEIIWQQTMS